MVAAVLASTIGRRSAASRIIGQSRTRSVKAPTMASTVSGSSQAPSYPVGWRPPASPPSDGSAYRSRRSP